MPDFYKDVPKETAANLRYRRVLLQRSASDKAFRQACLQACKTDVLFWINAFCYLFEPRPKTVRGKRMPHQIPFVTWEHQDPAILKIHENLGQNDIGLEKSRGEGASWISVVLALHGWLFEPLTAIGFVSRNEQAVDSPDDPDSLFWKLVWELGKLPKWMGGEQNKDWKRSVTDHTLKNLRNDSVIAGYAATGDVASGGRKAQPLTSKILTPRGWVAMGDLEVGSVITGKTGKPITVTGVYPQGKKEVFGVEFNDGAVVECCDDHLWLVTQSWERGSKKQHSPSVLPLSEIRKNVVVERGKSRAFNYQIPLVSVVEFEPRELPAHPYLIGCLLGDGCLSRTHRDSVMYSCADQEILDTLTTMLPANCSFKWLEKYNYRITDKQARGSGRVSAIKELVRGLGMADKSAHQKSIPNAYKFSSPSDRLEILRGLLDTDGWVALRGKRKPSCRVRYCSTSLALAEDVRFIVQSLGGVATMTSKLPTYTYKGEKRTGKRAYELTIVMPPGMNPFKMSRKAGKYVERCMYHARRSIVAVRSLGVKPVQCITVDAPDRLYVTDHCVVTHNSWFLMDELAKFPRGPDREAMASTQHVTNSRLVVSTPKGAEGAYFELMHKPSNMVRVTIDWRQNPSRNRGLYKFEKGLPVAIDPLNNPLPPHYSPPIQDVLDMFSRLRKAGFKLEGTIRSPWYDHECDRPGATPQNIAQELDRDYGGSMHRFFGPEWMDKAIPTCRPPIYVGDLSFDEEKLEPSFLARHTGDMSLWCELDHQGKPPRGIYVIGGDVASGLGGSHSSNSTLFVLDLIKKEQVAEFASANIKPSEFADLMVATAKWFHGAYLAWEINGPNGTAVTQQVADRNYAHVYYRKVEGTRGRKRTKKIGFHTGPTSKGFVFSQLYRKVRMDEVIIRSEQLVKEAGEYVWVDGKITHILSANTQDDTSRGEAHGDRVIAACVCIEAAKDRPMEGGPKKREELAEPPPNSMAARQRRYEESLREDDDSWDDRTQFDLAHGRGMGGREPIGT